MIADLLVPPPRLLNDPGPCPVIETKRLVLRPHQADDAAAIAASLGNWDVTRMLARVPMPYGLDDATDWLKSLHASKGARWPLAITDHGDHVGVVNLEVRHGQWHLGYWLGRAHWGRGLMSEAVAAALASFFGRLPGAVLHSGVFADNPASLRIQEKLGFAVLGCTDIYCVARNAMVAHIETQLTAAARRDHAFERGRGPAPLIHGSTLPGAEPAKSHDKL
jgi:RimJ/RimL family protein N-acetyltransferase